MSVRAHACEVIKRPISSNLSRYAAAADEGWGDKQELIAVYSFVFVRGGGGGRRAHRSSGPRAIYHPKARAEEQIKQSYSNARHRLYSYYEDYYFTEGSFWFLMKLKKTNHF